MTNWDGKVHSLLRPLKRCCHVNPAVLPEATDPDWEFDYIDIGSVSLSEGVTRKERMRFSASPSRARQPVSEGDVLVATVRTYLKAIAAIQESDAPQVASTGFAVLRAREETEPRFLYRIVQSNPFVEQVVAQSVGVSYPAINPSTLSNIKIPLPDIETQTAIADFLDRETARIDRLIEKKHRLVELLGEKRSTMIASAVTPAKDHGRARADSGGKHTDSRVSAKLVAQDVTTASWDRRKIKYHLAAFYGGGTPSTENLEFWVDGIIPWVTPKDMKRRMIDSAEDLITIHAVKNSATNMVPPYSVLMVVRSGILKHSLPVALNTVPVALNQDMKAFRFRSTLIPEFFAYWIEGQQKHKLLEWCQIGATVDNVDIDAMLNGQIAVPDVATQRKIVDFLEIRTATMDSLKDKTDASIDRLKEYRSALITAAVTGQIDVATWGNRGCTERHLDQVGEEVPA